MTLDPLLKSDKALFLAYDQGMEHGPSDFNDENANPEYIITLANSGFFTGLIVQKGIALKYCDNAVLKVPLIIKLNGKTTLQQGEPYSPLLCSVKEAIALGAKAVGYALYPGSTFQETMMKDFAKVEEEAHKNNLPVMLWLYPRGKAVEGKEKSDEISTYAARIGLELGADILKMHYPDNPNCISKLTAVSGTCKIVISGGDKESDEQLFTMATTIMEQGASGMAVGRNIWQASNPLERAKRLNEIVFGK